MASKVQKLFTAMTSRVTSGTTSKRRMQNAWIWYKKRSSSIAKVDRKALLKDRNYKKVAQPKIGRMYHYYYNPKTKDELPYFDRFPLILLVGPAKGGFYGLNLHYLPPRQRAILLDELIKIGGINKKGELNRLKLTYDLLQGVSKLKAFTPCFKHYLNKNLVTPPKEIPAEDWEMVLFLPTESFVGSKKTSVWKDSLRTF
jgi:hypothetical protein